MDVAISRCSEDDEGMRRVAAGESDALADLFDRHKRRLFGFLLHLTGDAALAEDLLAETFLRVFQARDRYRVGSGFVPWLLAIARNLAIGELRKRRVVARAQEALEREPVVAAWEPERAEMRDRVRQALAALPEEQRSALVLKEYQGMSYGEIARVLGCTEQAARARACRGRKALREALREWMDS